MADLIVTGLISALLGYVFGWGRAHNVIASECRRLGGFYFGKFDFKCTEIKDRSDD